MVWSRKSSSASVEDDLGLQRHGGRGTHVHDDKVGVHAGGDPADMVVQRQRFALPRVIHQKLSSGFSRSACNCWIL